MNELNASITLLWQGMGGIFIVMSIIALLVYGMGKGLNKKGE